MLKLLKAKVLGGSSAPSPSAHRGIASPTHLGSQDKRKQAQGHIIAQNDACVPHSFDVIHIDSLTSSTESALPDHVHDSQQPAHHVPVQYCDPCTKVDMDKSFAVSYRSAAAAKEYTLIKTINVGSTAKVQLAHHNETNRQVALKIMKKSKQHVKYMNREVTIHKQLCHENIVQLHDVIETPYHFVLAMEFLDGGDLFDLVPPNKGCTEQQALVYLQQLIRAVAHMHSRNVVHRDIKPENCVSDSNGVLKLIDFGAAAAADAPFTPAGTVPYMAPEMFDAVAHATPSHQWDLKAIDMWAVGVVYFTLLTGRFPWAVACEDRSPEFADYMRDTLKHRYPWFKLSQPSLHLLQGLLCPDPAQRLTVTEAIDITDALMMRMGLQKQPLGQEQASLASASSRLPLGEGELLARDGSGQQQLKHSMSTSFSTSSSVADHIVPAATAATASAFSLPVAPSVKAA